MRGVLALAAAFSLPLTLNDGQRFPQRNMIIFLTFCVIFATLVLQGLSMPLLIRKLGLNKGASPTRDLEVARRFMIEKALQALADVRASWGGQDHAVLNVLEQVYQGRLIALEPASQEQRSPLAQEEMRLMRQLGQRLRNAERAAAYALRDQDKIDDELLRTLQYEIDLRDVTEEV
jgi:CPA1 family monovalent cation:H+ antiporter